MVCSQLKLSISLRSVFVQIVQLYPKKDFKMSSKQGLLYIVPIKQVSSQPVIDLLTRKMTAALRLGKSGRRYMNVHTCSCGANSDNTDYHLPNGMKTNALAIHYLAFHREEIPASQLRLVSELTFGVEEPSELELCSPFQLPPNVK